MSEIDSVEVEKPYTVYYYRFRSLYQKDFETEEDCLNFIAYGLMADVSGHPKSIEKDGKEIFNEEHILEKIREIPW